MELEQVIRELRDAADRLERFSASRAARALAAGADPLAGAERAALAGEVASLVRHDLRNNLGSIRNAAFYLRRRVQGTDLWVTDARVPQFFALIDESVVASTGVLDERLSLKHLFSRNVARQPAAACVLRAVETARRAPEQTVEISAGPGDVDVDRDELSLAIRCLVENALEAGAGDRKVAVTGAAGGTSYVIHVTDEGSGIAEGDLARVFEPFRTTKGGHMGVGLNIARRVTARYGGELTIAPRSPGTTVTLAIPLSGAEAEAR